jgi:hypothetical protein
MSESTQEQSLNKPDLTRIRYLTPDMCLIHIGTHGALHVTVPNERIYGGVYAAYAFPVAYPDRYISLIHTVKEGSGKDIEIGIIRDLNLFPPEQVALIRAALKRRYFVHVITAIKSVGWKYGYIALEVDTDKGPASFMIRWAADRAVDYGKGGKVLIDVDNNRYLIPDVDKLPPRQKTEFQRYIYW